MLWIPFWHEAKAFSWQDGVMYLVFPDRFRDSDGQRPDRPAGVEVEVASYMGGDFQGVRQEIEEGYFGELGVNILWLSPVLENPEAGLPGSYEETFFTGFHGYWPVDPFAAETSFGGDDGFRVDAAKHMDHVIMRTLRHRLEELEARGAAEFYTVGETSTADRALIMDYVADYELHGQYDFPLMYAIRGVFAGGGSFRDLEGAARASEGAYGNHYEWMSPFLGNHDIPRFSTVAAGQPQGSFDFPPDTMAAGPVGEVSEWDLVKRTSMAYAFLLTQPGVPLLYYGDEVGLAGGGDPDNRRFMPWTRNANQLELRSRVQALGQARRDIEALRHGVRKELWLGDDAYAYVRDAGRGEVAIVAMNKGDEAWRGTVTIPNALGLAGVRFVDHLGSEVAGDVIDGELALAVEPWQYVVLVPASP